jgi:hypothetical protein
LMALHPPPPIPTTLMAAHCFGTVELAMFTTSGVAEVESIFITFS